MHLSHSQVGMYQRCQAQYMFRYERGLKMKPTGAMFFGTSFDDGVSANYSHKLETERDLSADDTIDKFLESFDGGKFEVDWQGGDPNSYREAGIGLVKVHMKEQAPLIYPRSVQDRIEIMLPNWTHPVVTVLDLTTNTGDVIDWKTVGKSPSKDPATGLYVLGKSHREQGVLYNMAFRAKYGRDAYSTKMIYHVTTKKPKIVVAETLVSREEESFQAEQIQRVGQAIELSRESGLWIPNRGHMFCSEKQCGFWNVCHEEFGPTIPETKQAEGAAA